MAVLFDASDKLKKFNVDKEDSLLAATTASDNDPNAAGIVVAKEKLNIVVAPKASETNTAKEMTSGADTYRVIELSVEVCPRKYLP